MSGGDTGFKYVSGSLLNPNGPGLRDGVHFARVIERQGRPDELRGLLSCSPGSRIHVIVGCPPSYR